MKKTRTVALLLMFLFLLNLISGCQQPTEKAIESSDKDTRTSAGYGTPPQAGGYGTPPPAGGYGTPPPAGGYGTPPPAGGYGTPPPAGGYGTPPPAGGYGVPGNR